jgi:hypothetical protein
MLPNVIIGGVQKAGTTSLFRYLAAHPSVCASSIKEIDFFLKYKDKIEDTAIQKYESFFTRCLPKHTIRLEASPQYLMYSDMVARKILEVLPDIKIIFILREPVSALFSYIKFKPGISLEQWSVKSFVTLAKNGDQFCNNAIEEIDKQRVLDRLQAGCYVNNIKNYLSHFSRDQIGVFFYDQLLKNSNELMHEICNFIDIDKNFYDSYQFLIENKTRSYKWPNVHRFATRINLKLEPLFNRYSFMRNKLREIYHYLFEAPEQSLNVTESDMRQIKNFYAPYNKKLRLVLMHHYPKLKLPGWLGPKENSLLNKELK